MDQFHDSMQKNNSAQQATLEPADYSKEENLKKHKRLFQRGCKWVGIGVLALGLSFFINFMLFHSNGAFIPFMYVLTSLGAICTMKGLFDILGG